MWLTLVAYLTVSLNHAISSPWTSRWQAHTHNQAERRVEVAVAEIVEENLPEGMEEEWNWKALLVQRRQGSGTESIA